MNAHLMEVVSYDAEDADRRKRRRSEPVSELSSSNSSLSDLSSISPAYLPSTADQLEPHPLAQEHEIPTVREPCVSIYLGGELQLIPQSQYLEYIWRHGLDSACMVCGESFDGDDRPPIRTFSFDLSHDIEADSLDITRVPVVPYAVHIHNRHLDCIKREDIDYIPISHAWHGVVSNCQEERQESFEAAKIAYQVPMKTLVALQQKYGAVEIWHDYLSVPQWHDSIQQQLLLAIPSIYSYPKRMVMHLDDVKARDLDRVDKADNYDHYLQGLAQLTKSRWFDRMWVTLEYIQGRDVQILTEDYEVFETNAKDLCRKVNRSNSDFVAQKGLKKFDADSDALGYRWDQALSWIDTEKWKKDVSSHTFGGAIYILGQKACRDEKDQYFALRAMLGLDQGQSDVATIVSGDKFQSYSSIAWQALEKGDYTPLLLTPPRGERINRRASWLRGHSHLTENLWNLGICRKQATLRTIIRDGRIMPELEYVGRIEEFEYYDFRDSTPKLVLSHVAERIFNCTGTNTEQFCAAIDRIFPLMSSKGRYIASVERDEDPAEPVEVPDYDHESLAPLLERLDTMLGTPIMSRKDLMDLLQKLIKALRLDKREEETRISRIEGAAEEADWYKRPYRSDKDIEGLAQVFCRSCGRRALFRMSAWERPRPKTAHAYRIPGLLFDLTIPEGVCLIVQNNEIVGRMDYGVPSCECHKLVQVELGSI